MPCSIHPLESLHGGAQYQAKFLLDTLVDSDRFNIFHLAMRTDPSLKPEDYEIRKMSDDGGPRRLGFFVDSPRLMNMLKAINPEFIYQRVACAYTGITAFYARKNSCRMSWHITHDNDVTPGKHTSLEGFLNMQIDKPIEEYGLRNANGIIAQTGTLGELLIKN